MVIHKGISFFNTSHKSFYIFYSQLQVWIHFLADLSGKSLEKIDKIGALF